MHTTHTCACAHIRFSANRKTNPKYGFSCSRTSKHSGLSWHTFWIIVAVAMRKDCRAKPKENLMVTLNSLEYCSKLFNIKNVPAPINSASCNVLLCSDKSLWLSKSRLVVLNPEKRISFPCKICLAMLCYSCDSCATYETTYYCCCALVTVTQQAIGKEM